ncbi:MAG: DUF4153 domain-containing protein [Bacteroidia bacterium]|nr:DUF4153 domain-containing protein [Bacteroidota bacterium]MBK7570986.1 DUF4153 domain-containing protein [Bacteroidota bacterium]MBP9790988.1 DUF4153 domain-containing protein [Bacteroidia bacterium]MBP9923457.1 DUF4153 domain-containing protein [Bacteroidia bacterium]
MRTDILNNLDNPKQLEKLYRTNKAIFKKDFNLIFPEIKDNKNAEFWNERLNYEASEISWGTKEELVFVITASFIAGLIAKLPELTGIKEEFYYPRNIGFIVFPMLTVYFAWKNNITNKKLAPTFIATLISLAFINFLPDNAKSDTLILSCIHLPLFLWAMLGYTFISDDIFNSQKRLEFLRYNGDLVVMTTLILIAGGILTGITIGLFSLIDFNIGEFYFEYIVIFGLAASPIVGTYITQTNPQLVNKVSPVIAKIFSPLVLITLIIYLIAIIASGKDPYNDREFLMIFNALLIGVMAIILFSVAETSRTTKSQTATIILFLLSVVTIIVNTIALTAIIFRISEWGITPNRLAVLGGNILILANLSIVSFQLLKTLKQSERIESVENSIATFLPIYSVWTIIVTFVFPILFRFK